MASAGQAVSSGSPAALTGLNASHKFFSGRTLAMDVNFIDTTFRDGHQSLWALGMRTGMIEAVAESMDQAGFEAMEVLVASFIHLKPRSRGRLSFIF
jgi:pyruvate carboxylase